MRSIYSMNTFTLPVTDRENNKIYLTQEQFTNIKQNIRINQGKILSDEIEENVAAESDISMNG